MAGSNVALCRRVGLGLLVVQLLAGCGGGSGGGGNGGDEPFEPAENIPPQASFTSSESGGTSPVSITFDASSSSDADGSIVRYQWDFGDGASAEGEVVVHEFDAGADQDLTAVVTLTVTDDAGDQSAASETVSVLKNAPPVSVITYSSFPRNRKVYFKGSESADPEGAALLYSWDFGDGGASDEMNPSHTYAANGQYDVRLLVDDQAGRTASSSVAVVVSDGRYRISGTVSLAPAIAVDGDTNDASSPLIPNNSLANPQPLSAATTVSGFVTALPLEADAVQETRFATEADPYDVYLVTLSEGQRVRLDISEWNQGENDLDLTVFNAAGELVEFSWGASDYEEVSVADAGEYFVVTDAYEGGSLYTITVRKPAELSSVRKSYTSKDPIVSGELLARPMPRAGAVSRSVAGSPFAQAMPLQRIALGGNTTGVRTAAATGATGALPVERDLGVHLTQAQRAKLHTIREWKRLRASGEYDLVDLNRRRYPTTLNDPRLNELWSYEQIGVPAAWDRATGDGVIVAVVDSGVVSAHEDLAGRLLPGYDFVSDPESALDGDGIDPNPEDPGDDPLGDQDTWHGTHVAGTVAAVGGNGVGIAGVAHGAKIMPVRVVGQYGGTSYDVIQGIYYAAGLQNISGTLPERRADIINLSLGSYGRSAAEQQAIDAVRAAGVIVVAAAGNDASNANEFWPAGAEGVVTVAAVGKAGNPAYYSNSGTSVDIAAPGGEVSFDYGEQGAILSTVGVEGSDGTVTSGYKYQQGTSMAAPHVSGTVALMKQLAPEMTPAQFDQLLVDFAVTDGAGEWRSDLGYGLLNAERALDAVEGLDGGQLRERFYFEGGRHLNLWRATQADIELRAAVPDLAVVSIVPSEPWLSASHEEEDAMGHGRYRVVADLEQLVAGEHSARLRFNASNGTFIDLMVSIAVSEPASSAAGYAGTVYVALVDTSIGAAQHVLSATYDAETGLYHYHSGDLETYHRFYVRAGTDQDGDGVLCEAGEVCGAELSAGVEVEIGAGEFDVSVNDVDLELDVHPGGPVPEAVER